MLALVIVRKNRDVKIRFCMENTLIGALGVLSLLLFILSFLPGLGLANRVGILLEMGHMVQRAFSVVLFILTFQLWKRKRAAWNIAVLLLFLSFLRGLPVPALAGS